MDSTRNRCWTPFDFALFLGTMWIMAPILVVLYVRIIEWLVLR